MEVQEIGLKKYYVVSNNTVVLRTNSYSRALRKVMSVSKKDIGRSISIRNMQAYLDN